jgi:hypothetical protein
LTENSSVPCISPLFGTPVSSNSLKISNIRTLCRETTAVGYPPQSNSEKLSRTCANYPRLFNQIQLCQ